MSTPDPTPGFVWIFSSRLRTGSFLSTVLFVLIWYGLVAAGDLTNPLVREIITSARIGAAISAVGYIIAAARDAIITRLDALDPADRCLEGEAMRRAQVVLGDRRKSS